MTVSAAPSTLFDPSAGTDPEEARRIAALTELADKDPRAACDLGLRCFRGDGVRRNSYQVIQWMRSAGERGDLQTQSAPGRFYLMGLEEMVSDPRRGREMADDRRRPRRQGSPRVAGGCQRRQAQDPGWVTASGSMPAASAGTAAGTAAVHATGPGADPEAGTYRY